jgi:hypothetical protein
LEAAGAYERAQDFDSLSNILLNRVRDLSAAAALIKKTKSAEYSKKLAREYISSGDYYSAIEFFIIAHMGNEAFEVAKSGSTELLVFYADLIREDASTDHSTPF